MSERVRPSVLTCFLKLKLMGERERGGVSMFEELDVEFRVFSSFSVPHLTILIFGKERNHTNSPQDNGTYDEKRLKTGD